MLKNGFIKLHRSFVNWEWYKNSNTARAFLHLIITANFEPHRFEGETIQRGERAASYHTLGEELDLSEKQIRVAIEHLKRTGEVASRAKAKYSVFTVVNYGRYQDAGQVSGKAADERMADVGQQCKKDKNTKETAGMGLGKPVPGGEKITIGKGGDF